MEFILWELPFSAGLGLLHAEGIFHGAKLQYVYGRSSAQPEHVSKSMADQLEAMRQRSLAGKGDEVIDAS